LPAEKRDLAALLDSQLVDMARDAKPGDLAAFDQLVERHQGHVRANCRYMTGNPQDAEDLAQDVFVKAYFALGSFQGRSGFKTWVRRIKANRCLSHLESMGRRSYVDIDDPVVARGSEMEVAADADQWLDGEDLRRDVGAVLDMLNETLRVPLVMRDMDQMTYEEIAEALDLGLSAVKMRIKRARETFREAWTRRFTTGATP